MKQVYLFTIAILAVIVGVAVWAFTRPPSWDEADIAALRGLWIGNLPALPPDPSNAYADNPQAALLGQNIFFDTRFSAQSDISCATCHQPGLMFTDGLNLPPDLTRTTMTVIGTAYSPWQFWDGRKDSQWAQALGPLESPVEHGSTRTLYAHKVYTYYREEYEAIFGALPDLSNLERFPKTAGPVEDPAALAAWETMSPVDRDAITQVFVNIGKAIAAYERLIQPAPSRFDQYVEALLNNDQAGMKAALTREEVEGLQLFIGKAECIQCHNGPLFTNNDFHNTGVPTGTGLAVDDGRASGVTLVLNDEFNCLSQWSDAGEGDCAELRYVVSTGEQLLGAFRVPTLRDIAETKPYMHAGQFATLEEVLEHYNTAPASPIGHTELEPIGLTEREMAQIVAFLRTLSGGVTAPPELLQAP